MLFSIEIVEQGWLEGCLPEEDPCSHGKIKLSIGEQQITTGEEDYGISDSALALLRTLESDHSRQQPVAQQLIFHGCSALRMMSCPIGVDWSVHHSIANVRISDVVRYDTTAEEQGVLFPRLIVDMAEEDYSRQVVAFATKAKRLFEGVPKIFAFDYDRQQYEAFWAEFDERLDRQNRLR